MLNGSNSESSGQLTVDIVWILIESIDSQTQADVCVGSLALQSEVKAYMSFVADTYGLCNIARPTRIRMFRFFVSGRMWDPLRWDDQETETSSVDAITNRYKAKEQH